MEIPVREVVEGDVIIERIDDAEKQAYHRDRFRKCQLDFVRDLAALGSFQVDEILTKYKATALVVDGEERLGLDFPISEQESSG